MFQAIPLVAGGAADAFGLEPRHLALACASHDAEPFHIEGVREMLARAGLDESYLHCGPHPPANADAARAVWRNGGEPLPVHNNCSGKHAGMLAAAAHAGDDARDYWRPEHPVQQEIRRVLAALSDLPEASIPAGVDGCGVPAWWMPVDGYALALARFAAGTGPATPWRDATGRLFAAMNAHPEMVAGTVRFCTAVIRAANRPVIAKGGAEGFYGVAWREGDRGVALAAKAAAGDHRSCYSAVVEAMRQLGLLDTEGLAALEAWRTGPIRNHAGEEVGRLVPELQIRRD
jgi:L-asparaginase II